MAIIKEGESNTASVITGDKHEGELSIESKQSAAGLPYGKTPPHGHQCESLLFLSKIPPVVFIFGISLLWLMKKTSSPDANPSPEKPMEKVSIMI